MQQKSPLDNLSGLGNIYASHRLTVPTLTLKGQTMYDNFPRVGTVTISGQRYPAEQQAPDGNFRKRSTRYFKDKKWSEWCKDDHDLFKPCLINEGRWEPFRLPEGAAFPEPMKFNTWEEGGKFIDSLRKNLEDGKVALYAGNYGVWTLPWFDLSNCRGSDTEWTRLALVHCEDYKDGVTKAEAVGNANARPVYLMHIHFAPGSLVTDHPCVITPVHKFATLP